MDIPLLEQLARQLALGRREAVQLTDAVGGRYRERAVLHECVRAANAATTTPNRLLCGDPALSIAALLSERRLDRCPAPGAIVVDLRPARDGDDAAIRFAQWIPSLFLLRVIAPDAKGCVLAPRSAHAALRLVLDASWPNAVLADDATAVAALTVTAPEDRGDARVPATLLFAADAARCLSHLPTTGPWIAFAPDARFAARVRHACIASGAPLDIAAVGAAPGEWTRRHAGGKVVEAMHAALRAFGATPIPQPQVTGMVATPAGGRRRAGMDLLLGECVRNGERTLVWVDAPDRRTYDASLCRAITRRDVAPWDRAVVLGWHFPSTFAQQFELRRDGQLDAYSIRPVPRPTRRGVPFAVDPRGFRPIDRLSGAWIDRVRSRSAPEFECLAVTLQVDDAAGMCPIEDWAIDPDHADEVFRGVWHASRDGAAGLHSARIRVPWRAEPRRVCIRALHADGGISDVILVVRHTSGSQEAEADARVPPPPPHHGVAEALC